jgi:hypothetical protein
VSSTKARRAVIESPSISGGFRSLLTFAKVIGPNTAARAMVTASSTLAETEEKISYFHCARQRIPWHKRSHVTSDKIHSSHKRPSLHWKGT